MKLFLILSLLCINNAPSSPVKEKKQFAAKKIAKSTSFNLAPSILIVY